MLFASLPVRKFTYNNYSNLFETYEYMVPAFFMPHRLFDTVHYVNEILDTLN